MQIRIATEADESIITEMGNKVLAHHAVFNPFYKQVAAGTEIQPTQEKLVYLATDDAGVVVGCIRGVFLAAPLDRTYPYGVIQSIWVEEEARGQGIAQDLIRTFETDVKERGAKQVDMFVDVQNELGLALWDAAGYVTYQQKRRKLLY